MTTYIRKLTSLDMLKWGQDTLDEQELQQFIQALNKNNQLWDDYKSNIVVDDDYIIYETLLSNTYNTEISVPVEQVITIAPFQTVFIMASEMVQWMDRYIAENGNPVIIEP